MPPAPHPHVSAALPLTFYGGVLLQCSNPFLNILDEDDEEDMVEELDETEISITKGKAGFGMEISASGHVVGCTDGGVAAEAGACPT